MIDKPGSPEIPIRCHQFLLRTTPDLRIVFSDSKVGDILRYNPEDILDLTIYQLITVDDIEPVLKAHMMILREEECQSVTPYVEMLCQGEGLAIVCFHLIKLPSKHSGTMFSISIICTFIGFSSRPTCFSSVQTMRPFDKNEIAGLGNLVVVLYILDFT
uniref:BTB_2 domain-containing protein n=1 Tax=Heterorhabditis bacteriophora TaxID=37862 RepID=A0A1I7XE17_HETBA